ncbi:MAG: low molecular weight protein-tyrosine-phosphatase [Gammaproteobacteria bacterium]|nr:low molecular weight protein-tyrosine-phosphatase [Gammaproteobacteria bacterium]
MTRILFVCMGNICRSPTAEGVFRKLLDEQGIGDEYHVDSAGTHAYHVGEPPDSRAQQAAMRRGIDLSDQRARQVEVGDFAAFDRILAMDGENLAMLEARCPGEHRHKLARLLDYAPDCGRRDVPDPYYGGGRGFEEVLDLVTAAGRGLLAQLSEGRPGD